MVKKINIGKFKNYKISYCRIIWLNRKLNVFVYMKEFVLYVLYKFLRVLSEVVLYIGKVYYLIWSKFFFLYKCFLIFLYNSLSFFFMFLVGYFLMFFFSFCLLNVNWYLILFFFILVVIYFCIFLKKICKEKNDKN